MPIGPVSPKDMGRAGRGSSSKGSVTAKGISKAKPKAKGLNAAQVKTLRQARLDDAREMQEVRYTGFSPLKDRLLNLRGTGGTRFNPSVKRGTGTSVSRGTKSSVSNNSARQKPVPTKPSKTGPQTRKLVAKKGK